jgi:iron complex outermembrane receptor protein
MAGWRANRRVATESKYKGRGIMISSRLSVAICLLAPLTAGTAFAAAPEQEGHGTPPAASAEDIVVTARRTAERLQDVPVAVTAVTGEAIEKRNMRTLADVQQTTPSLNLTTQNAQGSKAAIGLRGQRQFNSGITVDTSVGVYSNDVYMARTAIDTSLYDLESIQVLKGPQGTLFGRNSTGGAVLLSTKKPGDYLGGYARAQFEDPWAYTLEGAFNVPLGDGVALRVAGTRQYRRGYTDLLNFPGRTDGRNRYGGRATLKVETGDLSMLFFGDYYRWNDSGTAVFPLVRTPGVNGTAATRPVYAAYDAAIAAQVAGDFVGKRLTRTTFRPYSKGRNYSLSNSSTYQLTDTITLKNIIGYAATKDDNAVDFDGTEAPFLSSMGVSGQHQFSEEFQVQGKSFDNALDWIVGTYYFRESGYDSAIGATLTDPNVSKIASNNNFDATNSARSAFIHGSYLLPIGITAHVFGGARIGNDKREVTFKSGSITAAGGFTCLVAGSPALSGVAGGACALTKSKSFDSTTWDVGLDLKPIEDLLLYGSVSRGYRTGGFNGRASSLAQQVPFEPETVTNYEAGLKYGGLIGGMRTTLNAAVFHSLYTNIQQNINFVSDTGALTVSIINAAKARIDGLEVEFSIRPVQPLTLSGFYSLTDAKYKSFVQSVAGGGVQDLSANRIAGVPRHTAGGAIGWDIVDDASFGTLQFNLNFRYSSAFELQPLNLAGARIAGATIWNTSLRLEKAFGTPATLEVYAKNLFDKTYGTGGFSSTALGFATRTLGDPRVIGVGVRLPFGGE